MEPDQGTGGGGGCGGRRPARCGALGAPTTHASAPDRWEEQGREAAKQIGWQPHQVQPSVSSFHLLGGGGDQAGVTAIQIKAPSAACKRCMRASKSGGHSLRLLLVDEGAGLLDQVLVLRIAQGKGDRGLELLGARGLARVVSAVPSHRHCCWHAAAKADSAGRAGALRGSRQPSAQHKGHGGGGRRCCCWVRRLRWRRGRGGGSHAFGGWGWLTCGVTVNQNNAEQAQISPKGRERGENKRSTQHVAAKRSAKTQMIKQNKYHLEPFAPLFSSQNAASCHI